MTSRMRINHVLAARLGTVTTDSDRVFPVSFLATDEDGQMHVVQMTSIDAVRLGQRLTDAGRQVHAERKAARA